MHARWCCLFGYLLNPKISGNTIALCEWVTQFIKEAGGEEGVSELRGGAEGYRAQDEGACLEELEFSHLVRCQSELFFRRCRAALHAQRNTTPTPRMFMLKCAALLSVIIGAPTSQNASECASSSGRACVESAPNKQARRRPQSHRGGGAMSLTSGTSITS
jgi:hypothetical protein